MTCRVVSTEVDEALEKVVLVVEATCTGAVDIVPVLQRHEFSFAFLETLGFTRGHT